MAWLPDLEARDRGRRRRRAGGPGLGPGPRRHALCGFNREAQFKLAPAALTFHAVTDLNLGVNCGDSGNRLLVQPLSIAEITRAPTKHPTYHSWRVRLGWPPDGEISFGAAGFDQVLLAEPIISATNVLTSAQRRQMLG